MVHPLPNGMPIVQLVYAREDVSLPEFLDILKRSSLDLRRPIHDLPRLYRMLLGSNLIVTARDENDRMLVGMARSLTDWSYACYLADLAVDRAFQGQGIGRRLVEYTRELIGDECACVLISAPDAVGFYDKLGATRADRGYVFPRRR